MNTQAPFPQFWWTLGEEDKYKYACLRAAIASNTFKSQRNKRVSTFTETLNAIKHFAVRGDKDDNKRCLVCGICWLPEGIAINTHQLRFLISKCKSSINGSLQKTGFSLNLGRTEAANAMTNAFPILKDNTTELRKWTVRRKDDYEQPLVSPPPLMRFLPEVDIQRPKRCFEISLAGISSNKNQPQKFAKPNRSFEIPLPIIDRQQPIDLTCESVPLSFAPVMDDEPIWTFGQVESNLDTFFDDDIQPLSF